MRPFIAAALVATLVFMLSCADRKPAEIRIAELPLILNRSLAPIEVTVVNRKGAAIDGVSLSYAAIPPGIVEVSGGGSLRCLKTGDAHVDVAAGELSARVEVKCRIPTEVAMPDVREVILGAKPVALKAQAMTEGSRPMPDVPVTLTSSDPAVLKIENNAASGVTVGTALVKASLGGLDSVAPVTVIDRVVSETLSLADGKARSWKLGEGNYRVAIDVEATHRMAHGVTVSWDGSRCPPQPENQSHRFSCTVPAAATLTVANPTSSGLGLLVFGTITIDRVPGSGPS